MAVATGSSGSIVRGQVQCKTVIKYMQMTGQSEAITRKASIEARGLTIKIPLFYAGGISPKPSIMTAHFGWLA
jgi:hypothetical protein